MNLITERIDRITLLTGISHSEQFRKRRRANFNVDVRGTVCEKCIAYQD